MSWWSGAKYPHMIPGGMGNLRGAMPKFATGAKNTAGGKKPYGFR
jgi:hypothetical protein